MQPASRKPSTTLSKYHTSTETLISARCSAWQSGLLLSAHTKPTRQALDFALYTLERESDLPKVTHVICARTSIQTSSQQNTPLI